MSLITSAGEKSAREAVEYFERMHMFFSRIMKRADSTPLPVRVVAFRSPKEFELYRPNEVAAAFYMGGHDRDYIVMGGIGAETYPVALHEYTHLLVRHSGMKIPVWLNEGLAEVYSTLTPQGKKVIVGKVIAGWMYTLREEKWMPLARLVEVSEDSPEYNEKNRAGMFYAESWALAHMLMLDNELNCGALTSVPVRLEYRTDDTQSPPRRVLRSLELIKGS